MPEKSGRENKTNMQFLMGKVTFLSLPPTCWKELFNCVCLAIWSGAPPSFSLFWCRVSVSYHIPWLLGVCGNSCCHIFIVELWAAPVGSSAEPGEPEPQQIVGTSIPAWLTEPYLARTCSRLHAALCLCFLSSQGFCPHQKCGPQVQWAVT